MIWFEMFRIPFTLAGTLYSQYLAVDLARFALKVKYQTICIILHFRDHHNSKTTFLLGTSYENRFGSWDY